MCSEAPRHNRMLFLEWFCMLEAAVHCLCVSIIQWNRQLAVSAAPQYICFHEQTKQSTVSTEMTLMFMIAGEMQI